MAYRLGVAARRPASWLQLTKFCVVGGSGYLVNLAIYASLVNGLDVHYLLAALGSFSIALASNFFWNLYWTFGPSGGRSPFVAARFVAVSVASLCLNLLVLEALTSNGMDAVAAQAIAVAVAMPFSFVGNRFWTLA